MLGGGATLYLAYYAGVTFRQGIRRDQQHRAFEILSALNHTDYVTVRVFLQRQLDPQGTAPKDLHQQIVSDHTLNEKVMLLLGFFEDMSIAIQEGYADEVILYKSLAWMVPFFYDNLRPYVDHERRSCSDSLLFAEVEKLAGKWAAGESLATNRKFPQGVPDGQS